MSAAPQTHRKPVTAEEMYHLPDDARYELIAGELQEMPPQPSAEHGNTTERLSARATVYAEDHDLGECFAAETWFQIAHDPDTIQGPDWAFVAKERLPERLPRTALPLAPDIVLETRSPSDRPRRVAGKVARWLQAGVRMVWELDPATRTLTVHRQGEEPRVLHAGDTVSGEDILPGFSLPVERIFRPVR